MPVSHLVWFDDLWHFTPWQFVSTYIWLKVAGAHFNIPPYEQLYQSRDSSNQTKISNEEEEYGDRTNPAPPEKADLISESQQKIIQQDC